MELLWGQTLLFWGAFAGIIGIIAVTGIAIAIDRHRQFKALK